MTKLENEKLKAVADCAGCLADFAGVQQAVPHSCGEEKVVLNTEVTLLKSALEEIANQDHAPNCLSPNCPINECPCARDPSLIARDALRAVGRIEKKKKKSSGQHKCIRETNKKLMESNTSLVTNLFNPNHVFLATEVIKKKKRGAQAMSVVAAYCPFCGEKLEGT